MLVHHFLIANILLSTLFLKDSIRFLSFFWGSENKWA
jgi:hypothetical protein